jgi:hypothetical protein
MDFDDIYELLETVRQYKLRPREHLVLVNSMTGSVAGFATADNDEPSIEWSMDLRLAKETALARGTKEGERIRELLGSYMGRKQLLDELRRGTLEYGLAARSREEDGNPRHDIDDSDAAGSVRLSDLPDRLDDPAETGPRQCYIPGL